ncbi:MAG TPA: 50S ribosomal protein L10 [Nanoarchaeota archaeon]|nr:50S ribosomal protein L10 [Nanoarchaeota archaeon]
MKMAQQIQMREVKVKEAKGRGAVSPLKKAELVSLSKTFAGNSTFIIASINEMPALLLQKIRRDLRGRAVIKIVKRRVLLKLFEQEAKKDKRYEQLTDFCKDLKESCAALFSNEDIFKLIKVLGEKQERKRAKSGISKEEIIVEAGNTGLMPGPILTELADGGIKSGLEKGKVVIKERFVLKRGQMITEALSNALAKLGVLPVIAKLAPVVAFDRNSGILFTAEILDIDAGKQIERFKSAYADALNLALEVKYPTRESVPLFIQDAFHGAYFLVREAKIVNKESVKDMIAEAYSEASLLGEKFKN